MMKRLESNNLFLANVKIVNLDTIMPVVVYKKDDKYYDMRYVNSKLDLFGFNPAYYTEKLEYNSFNGLCEQLDKNSLKKFYNDSRIIFDIDVLHKDMEKIPGLIVKEKKKEKTYLGY